MSKYLKSQKQNSHGHYFLLPNEIFHLELKSGEILVYAYLIYCEDRKTFTCYPSYNTIGRAVGMTKNTVKKYVQGLVNKRLITTRHTNILTEDGFKLNGNMMYTIRPIQEAVEYFDIFQIQRLKRESSANRTIKALEEYDHKHQREVV